jgi:hypothetical protein
VLVAVALLAALLFEAGAEELRSARSDVARLRAASAMEGALSDFTGTPGDSVLEAMPVGVSRRATVSSGPDSTDVSVQAIGGSLFRLTVVSRVVAGRARARQGTVAFVRLVIDTTGGVRTTRFGPIAPWWRSPLP